MYRTIPAVDSAYDLPRHTRRQICKLLVVAEGKLCYNDEASTEKKAQLAGFRATRIRGRCTAHLVSISRWLIGVPFALDEGI